MAKRGPKPKKLKLLKLDMDEAVKARDVKCPDWLSPQAVEKWDIVVPELQAIGILATVDLDMVALYCESYAEYRRALAGVTTELIETQNHNIVQHPAVSLRNAAFERMVKLAREFGFTPASRLSLPHEAKRKDSKDRAKFFAHRCQVQKPGA